MTSEYGEQGDVPQLSISSLQSNEELASFHLQHGSDDVAGIFNREGESDHHCLTINEHVSPQSYGQGMPFYDDVSLFYKPGQDYLNKPVSDCSVSIRNEKGTNFEHTLGDSVASANIHANYQFPSIRNMKETNLEHAFGDPVASANTQANYLDSSRTGRNIMVTGADVVRGLQTCRPGGEYNDGVPLLAHNPTSKELDPNSLWNDTAIGETNDNNAPRPWLTRNQFNQACIASGHNSTIGELGVSNFAITGATQPNHPGVLDGNFLSLGCRTFEETDSVCDIHFPDREQITGGVLLPLFNTFPDARGSLNCSPNIGNGISSFPNFAGDNRNLTDEDTYRANNLGQNASSFPHQVWRANEVPNPLVMQNVEGSFNPMLNVGRFSHQAPATNKDRSSANNGLPNAPLPTATRMPSQSSKVGFTHPASDRPQNPPITTVRNFSPGPVMARPFIGVPGRMGCHGQSGPVTVPYNGVPKSMKSHGQSGPVVVPPHGVLRSMPWHNQSGHLVQANTVSAAEATEGRPFSKNVRVQQARKGIPGQSQPSVAVNPSKSTHAHASASASAQQIQQANVPQSSTIHSGPSLKRGASKLSPIASAAQRRKTRPVIPSGLSMPTLCQIASNVPPGPSMPTLRQIAPHVPPGPSMPTLRQIAPYVPSGPSMPTLRQIAPYVPSGPSMPTLRQIAPHVPSGPSGPTLRQIAPHVPPGQSRPTLRQIAPHVPPGQSRPTLRQIALNMPPASIDSLKPHIARLLQNPALLSSLLGTQSSHHIKWHEEDKQSPSGFQCSICKRDLSYTPEGPVYQPDKPLPTSVLPCGHYFHSSCLLQITPADQAGNPPCIPCALDG